MSGSSLNLHALGCALLVFGCSNASDPSALDAFPNRRVKLESAGHLLGYVANRESDTVSVVDLDAMTELGEAPVGRDPVDIDGPLHAQIDAATRTLYVVLSYPFSADSPHAIANSGGPRPGYVVAFGLDDLKPLGAVRVPASPNDVTFSDDHTALAVPHYNTVLALKNTPDIDQRRATVDFIKPASGVADETAEPTSVSTCVAPATVVYGHDGSRAFVACTGEDSLAVLDTNALTVLSRVPAGPLAANKPYALTRNAASTRLALSNQVAQMVVVFDTGDTPTALVSAKVPGVPFYAGWLGDDQLLVPVQGPSGLALVDTASGNVLSNVQYADDDCNNPSEALVLDDGRVFLTCEGDHYKPGTIVRIDPTSLAIQAKVSVGIYPDRLAVEKP
jgi:DNA-binding beta-propeller fold protein YncE